MCLPNLADWCQIRILYRRAREKLPFLHAGTEKMRPTEPQWAISASCYSEHIHLYCICTSGALRATISSVRCFSYFVVHVYQTAIKYLY